MAVILFYKGKNYLNKQTKSPVDIVEGHFPNIPVMVSELWREKKTIYEMIVFKGLVNPMALDHFQSILFYREYLRNIRYLNKK